MALALVGLAFALQALIWNWLGPVPPWLLLYPAVFAAAVLSGSAGGIPATFVATLLGWYFFVPARHGFMLENVRDGLSVATFAVTGMAFAFFSQQLRDVRAAQAVALGESRLRKVLDCAADAMLVLSADARLIYVNEQICRLLGYSKEEMLSMSRADIVAPEDAQRAHEQFAELLVTGNLRTGRTLITKDGRRVATELNAVTSPDGQVVATLRDIRERQRADEELRLKALLLDCVSDSIFVTDLEHRITYLNEASWKSLGYTHDELMAMSVGDLDTPQYAALIAERMATIMDGRASVFESAHRCKDGRVMPVEVSARVARINDKDFVIATVRDISARKQAEEQIRELSQAVEQSPENIVITDLDTKITYVNQTFLATTGYAWEEVIGQNPRMLQSGRTPAANYVALWEALKAGRAWSGELCNRRKDGSEYAEFAIISPIRDAGGEITHYVAVKEDVTEKKRMGDELERYHQHLQELVATRTQELTLATQAAEAANLAKSTFLATMSHEIRTPMNGVLGMARLLRRTPLSGQQSAFLDNIEASGEHLLAIINDILDLSKIEAGKIQLDTSDFVLAELMQQAVDLVQADAVAKGLRLHIETTHAPQHLHGDMGRLRQAVVNYLGNAIKFTDQGTVSFGCRVLAQSENDCLLHFSVSDTGIGLAEEQRSTVFQPFEQADGTITRRFGGTGLGLAITKQIAQLMGGEAGVESVPGVGSTFWLTVRLRCASAQPAEAGGKAPEGAEQLLKRDHRGTRILLVEDDPINQDVARLLLEDVGLVVDIAENGAVAVGMVTQTPYALLLMDVQMPVLDGMGATRAIRLLDGKASLPILAMTANAYNEDRERYLAVGMNGFIAKPFDPDELFAAILNWLPQEAALAVVH